MDPEQIRARLSARLREAQELRGVTTQELAKQAGVGRPHLHDVLAGKAGPSVDYVARLADVLDVDPATLLSDKPITRRTRRARRG
ncbi:MAG: helix-turn-helix transcriptional regulator [Nannocystaceae bacterium]